MYGTLTSLHPGEVANMPPAGPKSDKRVSIRLRGELVSSPWYKVSNCFGNEGWVFGGGIRQTQPLPPAVTVPDYDSIERDGKIKKAKRSVYFHGWTTDKVAISFESNSYASESLHVFQVFDLTKSRRIEIIYLNNVTVSPFQYANPHRKGLPEKRCKNSRMFAVVNHPKVLKLFGRFKLRRAFELRTLGHTNIKFNKQIYQSYFEFAQTEQQENLYLKSIKFGLKKNKVRLPIFEKEIKSWMHHSFWRHDYTFRSLARAGFLIHPFDKTQLVGILSGHSNVGDPKFLFFGSFRN